MNRVHKIPPRILIVDADPALLGLLEEWLEGQGCRVVADEAGEDLARNDYDLVVVDVPFARHLGLCQLKRVAERHPGVPILALSSSFFAGIARSGVVARALGVAGALPKPVACEALLAAVRDLLDAPR
jgi:DNA-binding response OmpR family regulator